MKSIKEKQMIVKWAKAMNEPIDQSIVEEVERYEQLQKEIIKSVKQNTIKDLEEASVVAKEFVEKINIEYPKPPTLEEVLSVITEEVEEIEKVKPDLITKAVNHITKEVKLEQASFQQPNPPLVDKNLEAIQKKLKFLEQAMGKMFAHGPGGGDANPFDRVEFVERGVRFTPTPRMMYWNNTEDCVNITQADGSTLQVGLENYIRVFNNTANTFANGTFVEFVGVDSDGDAPIIRPYVNNSNAAPLYGVGVLTVDVASNTHGRATVLGLVRNIDTTGNSVGETWSSGDLLWASPSHPGNYTKFKPTAPNIALSVAAVTIADATNGIILVRPTIWPRLRYGDFYSVNPQSATNPNQDTKVSISNALISSGFTISSNSIVASTSGLYNFQSRIQIASSSSNSKSIIVWYKKNGVNVPYSAVRQSVSENGGYRTITNAHAISLDENDNVSVHFAVTDTTLRIDSPSVFDGAPNIPSIQIVVTEAAL